MNFNFVFVVLVYRNHTDLIEFLESLKKSDFTYKVIVVNSFYDIASKTMVEEVSFKYACEFINIENKGYSYGNNIGVKYAIEHYSYDYLVISNPDIIVNNMCLSILSQENKSLDIIGPKIITNNSKNQNPFYYSKNYFTFLFLKIFSQTQIKFFLYISLSINKMLGKFYRRFSVNSQYTQVYALHGSFIIFSSNAINQLEPLFDENMFLFCEEIHLAELVKSKNMSMHYYPKIEVLHKEDGSIAFIKNDISKILINSLRSFFNNWS